MRSVFVPSVLVLVRQFGCLCCSGGLLLTVVDSRAQWTEEVKSVLLTYSVPVAWPRIQLTIISRQVRCRIISWTKLDTVAHLLRHSDERLLIGNNLTAKLICAYMERAPPLSGGTCELLKDKLYLNVGRKTSALIVVWLLGWVGGVCQKMRDSERLY